MMICRIHQKPRDIAWGRDKHRCNDSAPCCVITTLSRQFVTDTLITIITNLWYKQWYLDLYDNNIIIITNCSRYTLTLDETSKPKFQVDVSMLIESISNCTCNSNLCGNRVPPRDICNSTREGCSSLTQRLKRAASGTTWISQLSPFQA